MAAPETNDGHLDRSISLIGAISLWWAA